MSAEQHPTVVSHDGSLQCGHCGDHEIPLVQYSKQDASQSYVCLLCCAEYARFQERRLEEMVKQQSNVNVTVDKNTGLAFGYSVCKTEGS